MNVVAGGSLDGTGTPYSASTLPSGPSSTFCEPAPPWCSRLVKDTRDHSWASELRSMPLASAFRQPVSQSETGAFRYQTGIPYTGTELVPASAFLFIPVPNWLDAGQSDITAFKKGYTLHVHTASVGDSERDTHAVQWYTLHVHRQLLMVLFLLYDIEKSYVNAGMSECWRKVSPASAFLPVVSCLSPASVFRHRVQSGTAGHGLFRHCPVLVKTSE